MNAVAPPEPLILNQESTSDHHSTSIMLAFLVGLIVLLVLLILIFVFLKFIKPAQLKKFGKRKNSKKGYQL